MIMLLWCFIGVAIVSDVFMCAIEMITSKETLVVKEVADARTGKLVRRRFHEQVWNPTVANLTLMALGSSAPEILLNCIEIFSQDMFAGELGPSTIVGSAAFNLMIISAVCVAAIPTGEGRRIEDFTVFAVTATFSVFAYIWVYFILLISSPDIITPVEGVLTFVFFFVLIVLAYTADKGWLGDAFQMHTDGRTHIVGQSTEVDEAKAVAAFPDQVEDSLGIPVVGTPLAVAECRVQMEGYDAAVVPPSPASMGTPVAAAVPVGSPVAAGTSDVIVCSTPVGGFGKCISLKGLSEEKAVDDMWCRPSDKAPERLASIVSAEPQEGRRLPPSRAARRVLAIRMLTGARSSIPKNVHETSVDAFTNFSQVVPVAESTQQAAKPSNAKSLNLVVDMGPCSRGRQ
jgi:Ca2+/Na+ antiporter